MRSQGVSYQRISDALNAEGIATPAGGSRWARTYVARLVHTRSAREMGLPITGAGGADVSRG